MKLSKKAAIFAAALFSLGGAAYTYNQYGTQDNSMILANVEALSQDADGDDDGDGSSSGGGYKKEEKNCTYQGTTGEANTTKSVNILSGWNGSGAYISFNCRGVGTVYLPKARVDCWVGGESSCSPKLCPEQITWTF